MSGLVIEHTLDLPADSSSVFMASFDGQFSGVLRWEQLDSLWDRVGQQGEPWYVYVPGEPLPTETLSGEVLQHFLAELTLLLRRDHDEDYCGIVYVDELSAPTMIKVYDPHNLGSVCGSSGKRTLPGWVLSRSRPVAIAGAAVVPNNRKRWWQSLFQGKG